MRIYELFEFRLFEDRIDFLRNQFKDIPSNVFNQIVESDPTKNKIYTQWLLNLYKNKKLTNLNNVSKYLSVFDRWKHKLDKKDINQYHNINELIQAVDPHDNKTEELKKKYNINDNDFNKIIEADPTENKIYVKWLLGIYKKDKRLIEDLPKATRYLKIYDKKKNTLVTTINDYDDLPDLYQNVISQFDKRKDKNKQWDDNINDQIKVFYKGPEGQILIPKTKEASIYLGQGTQWCTAFTNTHNAFLHYDNDGPLYCIFTNDGRKYQFHAESAQLKDEIDRDVDFDDFDKKYPWVFNHIKNDSNDLLNHLSNNYNIFKFIKNPSEEVKKKIADKLYLPSDFFTSEKSQLNTIHKEGTAIAFIKNPTEEMKIDAVTNDASAIAFIQNPSEEVQLSAVNRMGRLIEDIKNPTEKVKLTAVSQNGFAIQYIKNPSEEVQLAAIKQNIRSIEYIRKPTEIVQLTAIKQKPMIINFINKPTPKAITLAKSLGYNPKNIY